jgi:hypothetical protein
VPEVTFAPMTDRGAELLDRLEAESGVYPFRVRDDGGRSYAVEAESLIALLDGFEADWPAHLAQG